MIGIHILLFLVVSVVAVSYIEVAGSNMDHLEDGKFYKAAAGTIGFVLMLVAFLILLTIQTQVKEIL